MSGVDKNETLVRQLEVFCGKPNGIEGGTHLDLVFAHARLLQFNLEDDVVQS